MIPILALTASAAPLESPRPSLWEAARKGVTWFFTNLSPAFLLAVLGILVCGAFFGYYWYCLRPRPRSLEWIAMAEESSKPRRLTLTLPCHPIPAGGQL